MVSFLRLTGRIVGGAGVVVCGVAVVGLVVGWLSGSVGAIVGMSRVLLNPLRAGSESGCR